MERQLAKDMPRRSSSWALFTTEDRACPELQGGRGVISKGSRPKTCRGEVLPGVSLPIRPERAKKKRDSFVVGSKGGGARTSGSFGARGRARGYAVASCDERSGVRQLRGYAGPWWSCYQAVREVQKRGLLRKGMPEGTLIDIGRRQVCT